MFEASTLTFSLVEEAIETESGRCGVWDMAHQRGTAHCGMGATVVRHAGQPFLLRVQERKAQTPLVSQTLQGALGRAADVSGPQEVTVEDDVITGNKLPTQFVFVRQGRG